MKKFFFIFLYAPWIYTIGLAMYFIILYSQKKKLPVKLIVIDMVFVGAFLYLHSLVFEKQVAFVGTYTATNEELDAEALTRNGELLFANLGIGVIAFFVIQLLFMKYLNRQIDKLNDPPAAPYSKKGII